MRRQAWLGLVVVALAATTCSVLPADRGVAPPPLDVEQAAVRFHGTAVLPASGSDVPLRLWSSGDVTTTTADAARALAGVRDDAPRRPKKRV